MQKPLWANMSLPLSYYPYFYCHGVRGVLRKPQLRLPDSSKMQGFIREFTLSPDLKRAWDDYFKLSPTDIDYGISYAWLYFEIFYLEMMTACRFNYRHIRHLGRQGKIILCRHFVQAVAQL